MKIECKPQMKLIGFKKRFSGLPFGKDRTLQEKQFICSTRAKQWLLIGASCDYSTEYYFIDNIDENGYDFHIAYKLDQSTISDLYNKNITGVDFIENLGFEETTIPASVYAIFETEKCKRPIIEYQKIRKEIENGFALPLIYSVDKSRELIILHWRPNGDWEKERFIEICIPLNSL